MPVQQQMSSLAKKLGGRVAQANAEHADKPIDTGNRRLPAGIKEGVGIARLSTMYWREYEDDKSFPGAKGQLFFRASAVVVAPQEHNGQKAAGLVTSVIVPLCDTPEKGQRKAKSFNEHWYDFQNIFKMLSNGALVCKENAETDPTGVKTEAFYKAAMLSLTDPVRQKTNPIYITFSTRGWIPPATPQNPHPEEMVFETWHKLVEWNGQVVPGSGMSEAPPQVPPNGQAHPPRTREEKNAEIAAQYGATTQVATEPTSEADRADVVASLVEIAMADPDGHTEDGQAARTELESMAWAMGWTKEQTENPPAPFTNDWAGVGDMAMTSPKTNPAIQQQPSGNPTVGSRWMFAKRKKDGSKLTDSKGVPFAASEVEVVTVDDAAKTCTVKSVKDGKDVIDLRTKSPVVVKWEWLESIAY